MDSLVEGKRTGQWRKALERLAPLVALILLVVITSICERVMKQESNFLKIENLFNILRYWSFVGIVAIGMTFVIISGGIDLSVGSLVACAGGIGIWLMNTAINAAKLISENEAARKQHAEDLAMGLNLGMEMPWSPFREWLAQKFVAMGMSGSEPSGVMLAIVGALLVAVVAGWLNGLLIVKGRIAPFIVTLSGLAAYRSIAMSIADGGEFRAASTKLFGTIGSGGIAIPGQYVAPNIPLQFPYPAIVFLVVAVLASIVLNRTRYGRYVCAIGANERSAVYSAINVDRIKIMTYTLMGLLTGISAVLVSSRTTAVTSSATGNLYELDAIAAVVIGGTRMQGGSGSIFGTIVGVLILGVIGSMLNFLDVSTYLQGFVKGVIIIAAVLLQRVGRTQ